MNTPSKEDSIIALFKNGLSMTEIGKLYGSSKQRVQQILKKRGINKKDGGVFVRKQQRARFNSDRKFLAKYGATSIELQEIDKGQYKAFLMQRRNARRRGIVWTMTFKEWLEIWVSSGKLNRRGKGGDDFVMSRYGDVGPYAVGNVFIQTGRENLRDGQEHWRQTAA